MGRSQMTLPVQPLDLLDLLALLALDLVGRGPAPALVEDRDRAADLDPAADPAPVKDPAPATDPVRDRGPIDQDPAARARYQGRADQDLARKAIRRQDRSPRRTRRRARSIGAPPRWAAPGTLLAASVHRTTAHHLRPLQDEGSAGMTVPRPVGHHLTGMAHRRLVAGTVLRLPAAGTASGAGQRVT